MPDITDEKFEQDMNEYVTRMSQSAAETKKADDAHRTSLQKAIDRIADADAAVKNPLLDMERAAKVSNEMLLERIVAKADASAATMDADYRVEIKKAETSILHDTSASILHEMDERLNRAHLRRAELAEKLDQIELLIGDNDAVIASLEALMRKLAVSDDKALERAMKSEFGGK